MSQEKLEETAQNLKKILQYQNEQNLKKRAKELERLEKERIDQMLEDATIRSTGQY